MAKVDVLQVANALHEEIKNVCKTVESIGEGDEDGNSWFFTMNNALCGFASIESNSKDIQKPTISIAIKLIDAKYLSRDHLLQLLDINGDLYRAAVTAADHPDLGWIVFLQYKVLASAFEAGEFAGIIEHLLQQGELFVFPFLNDLLHQMEAH